MQNTQRVNILKSIRDLVEQKFGPNGTVVPAFREVAIGVWDPAENVRPKCWVVDGGCRSSDVASDSEISKGRTLSVTLQIALLEDFTRLDRMQYWSGIVDAIDAAITNHDPKQCVKTIRFTSDVLAEVQLSAAATAQVWTIDFEVDYVKAFEPFGHK